MARLAIFMDGGYINALSRDEFGFRVDPGMFAQGIIATVQSREKESIDLLRTMYYNCLPYQGTSPTLQESQRFAEARGFFNYLGTLPRFEVRQGQLHYRGNDSSGKPIYVQKGIDLLMGLDLGLLSGKRTMTHAAVVTGDSDFIPAFKVAKDEGIAVWLFHGPRISQKDGKSTFALALWNAADERFELTSSFMQPFTSKPRKTT